MENYITRTFGRLYRSTVGKLGPAKDWQLWQSLSGAFSGKEVSVNQKSVLSIPAYWRAVDLIATQVASLPFNVYTVDADGKISEARTNPIWKVLNFRPSPEYDYFTFMEAILRIMLTGTVGYAPGNCLIHIIRDNRGAVAYLDLIHDSFEVLDMEPGIVYMIGNSIIPASDIIHIKAWTKNGLEGDSPLKALSTTFKRGISEITTFTDFYKNGANVSGLLETDSPLNPTQRKELEDAWARNYSGVANQGKTALLSHGVKYKTIGTRLNESDLSSRRMTVEDIANITGVPLPLLSAGDKTPLNNLEVLNRLFVQYTLRAWCKRIESEFNSKLFSESEIGLTFVRFNLDGLLRGDTQSRANYYKELYNIRAISPNEIRALENMNPYDGGDEFGLPLASNSTTSTSSDQPTQDEMDARIKLFDSIKSKMDAYGVAVRAGVITPQFEDEASMREEAGLPPASEAVVRAWTDDEGYRRPITLKPKNDNLPIDPNAANGDNQA